MNPWRGGVEPTEAGTTWMVSGLQLLPSSLSHTCTLHTPPHSSCITHDHTPVQHDHTPVQPTSSKRFTLCELHRFHTLLLAVQLAIDRAPADTTPSPRVVQRSIWLKREGDVAAGLLQAQARRAQARQGGQTCAGAHRTQLTIRRSLHAILCACPVYLLATSHCADWLQHSSNTLTCMQYMRTAIATVLANTQLLHLTIHTMHLALTNA
jgi:hypothetical protein